MSSERTFFRWRPHPWHGLSPGPGAPARVLAYIEITPFDLVKYEVDFETGYLKVDRPQHSFSLPPTLYGFIPRTCYGPRVAALSPKAEQGDGDPLDICVISGSPINRSEVILEARVLGGLQTIDHAKADDKIIAVLAKDAYWGSVEDLEGLPANFLTARLRAAFHRRTCCRRPPTVPCSLQPITCPLYPIPHPPHPLYNLLPFHPPQPWRCVSSPPKATSSKKSLPSAAASTPAVTA